MEESPVGPVDATRVPRFAGPATFARLPSLDAVGGADVAVVGAPFDAGVSYRPGARFGPAHIRQSSRLLRPYNPAQDVSPFAAQQVADAGDIAANPFDIQDAIRAIEAGADQLLDRADRLLTLGGDHTIALPLLRSVNKRHGPVAVLHFDAHLDTWDTYFGEPYTHGTPFRRASEEGLIDSLRSLHVGIRGPLYAAGDLADTEELGYGVIPCTDYDRLGLDGVVTAMRERLGTGPVYVSVDIDVVDPGMAPGTGTPEPGGMLARELLRAVRQIVSQVDLVGMDVVEVSPPYDDAEITALLAHRVVMEAITTLAATKSGSWVKWALAWSAVMPM